MTQSKNIQLGCRNSLLISSSYEKSVGITDELEELLLADSDSDNDVLDENGDEFDGFE